MDDGPPLRSRKYHIICTSPIASTMNLSGLKIDLGNATSRTSSTWSIPNISVTPVPPNPTNTQLHVPEGPGSTPYVRFVYETLDNSSKIKSTMTVLSRNI
ncbi:hypothetical protein O181_105786 [Austropuccinia psidii MF-1]|uniref:Uncharacterized protein n=1 Tax=Austropuccinia psidii MF-1 TaxID=1389203 RepID=A0A9Q3JPQ7_9BASI|nr:hypothetical protein [Austropuccinia psidii MF-1]